MPQDLHRQLGKADGSDFSELSARSVSQCTKYSATSFAPACNLSSIIWALRIAK